MNEATFGTVAIAAKTGSREAIAASSELSEWLRRRGIGVALDERCQRALGGDSEVYDPELEYGLVVVLGGDGTLMSVARAQLHGVPILGVNLGGLGFLTEINRGELYPSMVEILAGGFTTEARSLLDVELERAPPATLSYKALNDVVITKSALSRIIDLRVEVDRRLVARYRSDGLILSTPTGSTAYNLSAGGPIVYPTLPVIVLTPICPHTLTHRPLVVPASSLIDVRLETSDEEVYLTIDGQEGTTLEPDDRVRVRSSQARANLVRISGRSFYDSLRSKLRWGS
ncbi:MAG TPA: NAD(+)/NADH kinase [Thermoanaerobaculia bacterium]|nr:NAD(+)/NADH kinase [Thermoanaerobaculia bacterium]